MMMHGLANFKRHTDDCSFMGEPKHVA